MKLFFHYFCLITMVIAGSSSCMQQSISEQKESAGDFGHLPKEILEEITSYCQPIDRYVLRCTCKYLNEQLAIPTLPHKMSVADTAHISSLKKINCAGDFGKLPQELVHEIGSYCDPVDRCAMRCTGKYLYQQLQSLKENDRTFLLKRKKLRHKILKQNLFNFGCNYGVLCCCATKVIDRADITLELIAFLYGFKFINMAIDYESGRWSRFPIVGLLLQLPICLTVGAMLVRRINPFKGYQSLATARLCTILFRRPTIYICGIAQYSLNRNKMIIKAQQSFYDQQEYLASKLNAEAEWQKDKNNSQIKRAHKLEKLRRKSPLERFYYHLHQAYKWINPSTTRLAGDNCFRICTWIHRDILNALPSRKANLPVQHDE